jgi:triacylglycerol esterase/lipase EstA (alpha/beta hydrolase family)
MIEAVLVVHGHGAPAFLMAPLCWGLKRRSFDAMIFRYGSLRGSIAGHAERLGDLAEKTIARPDVARIHFVGHSMGAILVRCLISQKPLSKLGRVVLLAPPNHGARLADLGVRLFGARNLAAYELSSRPDSFVNRLPAIEGVDVGVIAAAWDHIVRRESAHLPGERDFLVLKSLHTLPLHYRTCGEVAHFLRHGRFRLSAIPAGERL